MAIEPPARITRVVLKNYKSIVACDVELQPLTILVGPNGSGKSNFVDALRFVKQALVLGLDEAVRARGNIIDIRSMMAPRGATPIGIDVHFRLSTGAVGVYAFELGVREDVSYAVNWERLVLGWPDGISGGVAYTVEADGSLPTWNGFTLPVDVAPKRSSDLLYLKMVSGFPEVRPVYDLLAAMVFYNLNPSVMRLPGRLKGRRHLLDDGANLASMLRLVRSVNQETLQKITEYLSHITPGIEQIEGGDLGGFDSIEFLQRIGADGDCWRPVPHQMSDGTLRALAVLVALFQGDIGGESGVSLVGIEEPESGLHPAAADVLFNALIDASTSTQVLVTTHSADLLQSSDLDVDSLLAVEAENGVTKIGRVDKVGRSVLRDKLFTAGELLQMKQLRPETNGSRPAWDPAVAG